MSKSVRLCFAGLGLIGAIACAPRAATPPVTSPPPEAGVQQSPPASDSSAAPVASAPTVIAPTPPECAKFVGESPRTGAACPQKEQEQLIPLDAAMAESDPVARDAKLRDLEQCAGYEPGLVRALRADLAPTECADAIVEPVLAKAPETLSIEVSQVLRGLALAARLLRTSDEPPLLTPPFTRERFNQFLNSSIRPWYLAQSKVVFDLGSAG
ncbi:MAG TPA: hypothetical protein VKP30_01375, partial [Polyangiaceae bacterium]|nr:hypothetical protein [Polyangiaceae bacterium]